MASAQAITYDQNQALSEYRRLHYAHLQHCSIFDALVHRQAGRAETLMREHSSVVILGETLRNVLSAVKEVPLFLNKGTFKLKLNHKMFSFCTRTAGCKLVVQSMFLIGHKHISMIWSAFYHTGNTGTTNTLFTRNRNIKTICN